MRYPPDESDPTSTSDKPAAAANTFKGPLSDKAETNERKAVLQCVGRYDLYGHVEAMTLMKMTGKERDCLVLVFRDAKM
jgi:hypothetical protein